MKKILVLLAIVVLSFPVISYAEYYFVACKEGTIFKYSVSDEVVRNFKKGELFIASRGFDEGRLLVYSLDNDKLGYVNPKGGQWFVSESSLINVETVCSTQQMRREQLEAIEFEKRVAEYKPVSKKEKGRKVYFRKEWEVFKEPSIASKRKKVQGDCVDIFFGEYPPYKLTKDGMEYGWLFSVGDNDAVIEDSCEKAREKALEMAKKEAEVIAEEKREEAERARIEKEKREKEEREEAEAKRKEAETKRKEEGIKSKGVTEGMGGLRWGDTTEEFSRLRNPSPSPTYGEGRKFTNKISEHVAYGTRYYMISGIGSHLANYYFYKNKFYYFSIDTGSGYGEMIKQALISKYGQPKEISPLVLYINPNAKVGTGYGWEVKDVTITLNINNMKNESHLSYIHIPTLKLRISDDKKTSEGMKKDL